MKIQCDVCSKDEVSVFCTADEAALCAACDHRVHHANKLAPKHQRFSLLHPSAKNFPPCDICQEKRASLFCQQDRAILCKDCDGPIHKANEHTQKHNRFLLTGSKLSSTSALYSPSSSSSSSSSSVSNGGDFVPDSKSKRQQSINKPVSVCPPNSTVSKPLISSSTVINKGCGDNLVTSTISEYLMETLPGWHVEDFLDFCKPDEEILPLVGADNGSNMDFSSMETVGICVPQAPIVNPSQDYPQMGPVLKETKDITNMKTNNRRWTDDAFTVPQISNSSSSGSNKRARPF